MIKIALITPISKYDYLVDTIINGLSILKQDGIVEFATSSVTYQSMQPILSRRSLPRTDFVAFAQEADLILLAWGKDDTDRALAEAINRWDKTIYIDGSELGKNRRYDMTIRQAVLDGTWIDNGGIDFDLLKKCQLYFRREKPYVEGIIPLPLGIESRYIHYTPVITKDIDFVCIFGQEEYPPLRKQVREAVEEYCQRHDLRCVTQKTKTREEFYDVLSRSKIGVSVGGGGFDTARFWEMLGNNCSLLTENIDIFNSDSPVLAFRRIKQFGNVEEFRNRLEETGELLKKDYGSREFLEEYSVILERHSSVARVRKILAEARQKKLIP